MIFTIKDNIMEGFNGNDIPQISRDMHKNVLSSMHSYGHNCKNMLLLSGILPND